MGRRIAFVLLLGLAVSACDWAALVERTAPQGTVEFAKSYIALFRQRDFATIEKKIDPAVHEPDLAGKLARMAALLPDEDPKTVALVAWRKIYANGQSTTRLEFQYEFASAWALVVMVLKPEGTDFLVRTVTFTRLADSLQNLNRFTLSNKPVASYLFLAYTIATAILMIYAAVAAYRTPIPKRKWLWIVFVLIGFCGVTLNWTTGQFTINPISAHLLGVFLAADTYSPVLLTASLPLGAIVFLSRRNRWRAANVPAAAAPAA